jgi:hypothetical protein
MARLLVLTDRIPEDPDWKGALAWQIIQSLAEAQHEVLVATPHAGEIDITHPRLQVTSPIKSWRVDQMPKLAKLILTHQPRIVHTFALRPSSMWPALSLWPYLNALCQTLRIRRYTTLFEAEDWSPTQSHFVWHRQADGLTVFREQDREKLKQVITGPSEIMPLELAGVRSESTGHAVIVPAPVDQWSDPERGLSHLAQYLLSRPNHSLRIIGGFGDWPASKRREGWKILEPVTARVSLTEPVSLTTLMREMEESALVWLEVLPRESWKFLISIQLARQLGREVYLSSPVEPGAISGSSANRLSRLYVSSSER